MTEDQLRKVLVNARKTKSFSQEKVADLTKTGITRQYYGMIENCERRPSVELAKSIGSVLGIDWTLFFEVEGNKKFPKAN